MNGRMKDAQKALGWIRGWLKPEAVQKEFQQLLNHIEAAPKIHRTRSIDNETYQMVPTADCETGMLQDPSPQFELSPLS